MVFSGCVARVRGTATARWLESELPLVLCRWYAGLHVAHDMDAGAHDDEYVV
jgi:hypothetical protein